MYTHLYTKRANFGGVSDRTRYTLKGMLSWCRCTIDDFLSDEECRRHSIRAFLCNNEEIHDNKALVAEVAGWMNECSDKTLTAPCNMCCISNNETLTSNISSSRCFEMRSWKRSPKIQWNLDEKNNIATPLRPYRKLQGHASQNEQREHRREQVSLLHSLFVTHIRINISSPMQNRTAQRRFRDRKLSLASNRSSTVVANALEGSAAFQSKCNRAESVQMDLRVGSTAISRF